MKTLIGALALILGSLVLVVIIACLLAWPVMLLWNGCLVGAITGVNVIGFWQALGLMLLSGILFKSNSSSSKKS